MAEQIAKEQARHPLETLFRGRLRLNPPPELGLEGGLMFARGVFERLDEIAQMWKMCN
jgi:hypothetical protein